MGIASAPANDVRDRQEVRGGGRADEDGPAGRPGAKRPAGTEPGNTADAPPPGKAPATFAGRPAPRGPAPSTGPVFVDMTGRRSRTWRRAGTIAALCCACYATTLVATLIGSDSSAPFLQLPRAMGLEREGAASPAPDGGQKPAGEAADGTAVPATSGAAVPSRSAEAVTPQSLRASSGPSDIPVVETGHTAAPPKAAEPVAPGPAVQDAGDDAASATKPSTAPDTGAESGAGTGDGSGNGAGNETPADSDDDAPATEPEDTAASGHPLGDLVGGLLGGLLGI
ncbi:MULTISPECIES: hypothetical protein [unclassified Streptomyces]|uniref:hypothetical protein n=1 Tax=unclassified Streptomyces TaxID=2593676 RepID=UPI0011B0B93D|nr:hypothetical protein [Streptomyces sp. SM10]